jgi:hypothetical protein
MAAKASWLLVLPPVLQRQVAWWCPRDGSVLAGWKKPRRCPMPAGASKKRERQYEHIKDSYQERGVSKAEAEERAARTVNKERRKAGETKKKKS